MKQEIRFHSATLRAVVAKDEEDAELFQLEGIAASYDTLSPEINGFRERISKGAFQRSLREGHDVYALLNHDPSKVLGRTKSGTLNIFDLPKGLGFKVQLDPQNSEHRNIHSMVKRGDISSCSFAFSLPYDDGDVWDDGIDENGKRFNRRTLKNVKLHDVSVVTYPYYSADGSTSVDARATSEAAVDAYNRRRCEEIGREIEADTQRRIEGAGRAVAADRAKGEI